MCSPGVCTRAATSRSEPLTRARSHAHGRPAYSASSRTTRPNRLRTLVLFLPSALLRSAWPCSAQRQPLHQRPTEPPLAPPARRQHLPPLAPEPNRAPRACAASALARACLQPCAAPRTAAARFGFRPPRAWAARSARVGRSSPGLAPLRAPPSRWSTRAPPPGARHRLPRTAALRPCACAAPLRPAGAAHAWSRAHRLGFPLA
ncbi:hypothetical protein PAHAL_7G113100 [Panicum hallii]|uniref:Uncharacterized protein n=1 Tax=Panicum hallii TaxID=206008 RepID=A0A2T8IBY8_9POAL|nr:hypothetical protein PAHAL_7G113100 [Panicum hallii]